jgi:2-polyprenyl-3-methyl-5-hydroxy-6-metoxy-1,4-benzoquinol methylase
MLDFIEHSLDPIKMIRRAARLLKNNGVIIITTPDSGAKTEHLIKKHWPHYLMEHVNIFSGVSIKRLLKDFTSIESWKYSKILTLKYFFLWFSSRGHILAPFFKVLYRIFPEFILRKKIKIKTNEMLVIARMNKDVPESQ